MTVRILVAGIGNDLLQDDGFGIAVIRRLAARTMPAGVVLYEAGIAGIGLVQELLDGYDALVIVDAAERAVSPGTLQVLSVDVPDPAGLPEDRRRELISDMHWTVPSLALILARALDSLPRRVFIVGCQPGEVGLGLELTSPVEEAVDPAVDRVVSLVEEIRAERASHPFGVHHPIAVAG